MPRDLPRRPGGRSARLRHRPGHASGTGERVSPEQTGTVEERLTYLRHLFAYQIVSDQLDSEMCVIDVGCGEGYGTHLMSSRSLLAVGLDVDRAAIQRAAQQYGSGHCLFVSYDGGHLPFGDNTVDVVVAMQVLEHIEADQAFLREVGRVLARKGQAFLTTPNRAHRLSEGQKPWNRFHVREYSQDQLAAVLRGVFSDVRLAGVQATEPARSIEMKRIRRLRTLARLDPLGLRRVLPGELVHRLGQRFGQDSGLGTFADMRPADLFFLDDTSPAAGLDLFARVQH